MTMLAQRSPIEKAKDAVYSVGFPSKGHAIVAGSDTKRYHVYIKISDSGVIRVDCQKELGSLGQEPCLGNSSGVCYHSIAAVMKLFRMHGFKTAWSKNKDNLIRLRNTGGGVHMVVSKNSGAVVYLLSSRI
jgi:hypothetical protein